MNRDASRNFRFRLLTARLGERERVETTDVIQSTILPCVISALIKRCECRICFHARANFENELECPLLIFYSRWDSPSLFLFVKSIREWQYGTVISAQLTFQEIVSIFRLFPGPLQHDRAARRRRRRRRKKKKYSFLNVYSVSTCVDVVRRFSKELVGYDLQRHILTRNQVLFNATSLSRPSSQSPYDDDDLGKKIEFINVNSSLVEMGEYSYDCRPVWHKCPHWLNRKSADHTRSRFLFSVCFRIRSPSICRQQCNYR